MAGRVQSIGGKLYYSSDSAASGTWGTEGGIRASPGNSFGVDSGAGPLWFPVGGAATAAPTAAAAAAPSIAPVLDNNVSVSVYGRVIPISAGRRRIPGDLIWLKQDQLNTEGDYTANGAYSFGYRLTPTPGNLVKVWANGVKIYDAEDGFQAEGFTFVWYDGSQTEIDPEISADKGADITPAYKEQLYIRGIFPTKEFNGSLPNISVLISDDPVGFRRFLPWAASGSTETLNPDDCSVAIELSNGDQSAERVGVNESPFPWKAVRSTKGRASNQPDGHGWFVFEAVNDHITNVSDPPLLGSGNVQGPGLATEAYDLEGGTAGDAQSLVMKPLGHVEYNGGGSGPLDPFDFAKNEGAVFMVAVRLDVMKMWEGVDADRGWELHNPDYDPIENVGGYDISFMSGHTVYPAWFSRLSPQTVTMNFPGAFVNTAPGASSPGSIATASTLTEIIVAVGIRCGFSSEDFRFVGLDNIMVMGIVITSDTDFLSFLKNAGRIYGYDYTESGGQILCRKAVIGTSYTVDVDDIPEVALIPTSAEAAVTTTRDSSHRPEIIELKYQDSTIDYQPSLQRARIPRIKSPMTDSFGVPFVMSAKEAITGAATALYREHYARVSHGFQLPFQFQRIEPTDLIQFTSSGKALTVKVTNVVRNSDLSVKLTAVNLLTAEAEPITDTFAGENYQGYVGNGYSGDPNIGREPLEIPPPITITSSATFSIVEETTAVATLAATGGVPPYTWTKIGGADAAQFTLSSGGVLAFATAPEYGTPTDADTNNVYLVQVQAATTGGFAATQSISVTVTALPPVTVTSSATFTIAENTTAVGTLTASGGDGGPYTWTKTGGADAALFTLTSGGVLSFTIAPDFDAPTDADANNVYLVTVTASDGVRTGSQNISVTVTDVLELFTKLDFSKYDNSGYIIFLEDI
jgi:hypothetical protein